MRTRSRGRRGGRGRRGLALAVGLGLALLPELGLRAAGYGGRAPFFLEAHDTTGRTWAVANPAVGDNWFRGGEWEPGIRAPRPERFLVEKPAGTKRIFVLGESSVYGTPWPIHAAWPALLETILDAGGPTEVVNVGVRASGLDVQAGIVRELVEFQPDLFVVYAGHNAYYGVSEPAWWARLAVVEWAAAQRTARWDGRVGLRADDRFLAGDPRHAAVDAANAAALGRLIAAAGSVPVEVVLPVANERDVAPVGSDPDDAEATAAVVAVEGRDPPQGNLAPLRALAERLPTHAGVQHALGRLGDSPGERFSAAVDLDTVPLRARSTLRAALAAVPGATVCDPAPGMRARTPDGQLGDPLFVDHVHPSLIGGHALAVEVARCLGAAEIPTEAEVLARVTPVDAWLGWSTAERYFSRATVAASPSTPRSVARATAMRLEAETRMTAAERSVVARTPPDGVHAALAVLATDPATQVAELRLAVRASPHDVVLTRRLAKALRAAGDEAGAVAVEASILVDDPISPGDPAPAGTAGG